MYNILFWVEELDVNEVYNMTRRWQCSTRYVAANGKQNNLPATANLEINSWWGII